LLLDSRLINPLTVTLTVTFTIIVKVCERMISLPPRPVWASSADFCFLSVIETKHPAKKSDYFC